jgi:hypothetical protein
MLNVKLKLSKVGFIWEAQIYRLPHGNIPSYLIALIFIAYSFLLILDNFLDLHSIFVFIFLACLFYFHFFDCNYFNGKTADICDRGNKVAMDRAQKKPKVVIRNWECGVVSSPEKLGFGSDSWDILKRFMIVDGAVPVVDIGKPWIREESDVV